MDRDQFQNKFAQSRARLEELVALAGPVHVGSYTRTSKTGKTVHVSAYTRDPGKMSNPELFKEFKDLSAGSSGLQPQQAKNRLASIVTEIRKRKNEGTWGTKASEAKPQEQPKGRIASAPDAKKPKTPDVPGDASKAKVGDRPRPDSRAEERVRQPVPDGNLADFHAIPSSALDHLVQGPNGLEFSPERQKLHREIIEKMLEGFEPQENPRFHVMGGGPASGKSVMEKSNPEISDGHALINPDDIKEMLPEYHNEDGSKDASFVHEESSYLAGLVQAEGFARRINMTLDGTGNSSVSKMIGKLKPARDAGYEINGYYVTVDSDIAVQRAQKRGERTGRFVAESVIRDTHKKVSQTLPGLLDEFDNLKIYDNSGAEPVLIGEKTKGSKFAPKDDGLWQKFLDKGKEAA